MTGCFMLMVIRIPVMFLIKPRRILPTSINRRRVVRRVMLLVGIVMVRLLSRRHRR